MHAKLFIEKIGGQEVRGAKEIHFDDVKINAEGKKEVEVVFANGSGDLVRLVLPREKLKELVSWKTLLSM